jgi:GTP cyclohydrolase I
LITVTEDLGDQVYHGLVSGLDIPFLSFCEHHFLPFFWSGSLLEASKKHEIDLILK